MAIKKADMEAHRLQYQDKLNQALEAESQGLYRVALDAAVSAWKFIDWMMQYVRKCQDAEFSSIPAIDLVSPTGRRLGVYEIVSDEMRLSLANAGANRPLDLGAASIYRTPR